MRVGIIQSCYIPWRGYFDFINSVDLFIVYDDVQYPVGRSWRNRNQVKTKHGLQWLTVPVQSKSAKLAIDEVRIANMEKSWQTGHRAVLKEALATAPYFSDAIALWEEAVSHEDTLISDLNVRLIRAICRYLGISTPIAMSRQYGVTGAKTQRLINLLRKVDATSYLSGPSAKGYLDENLFREHQIRLEYKTYDYMPYPQLFGNFEGTVTVLDLLANCGPEARGFITSQTPNVVAVE